MKETLALMIAMLFCLSAAVGWAEPNPADIRHPKLMMKEIGLSDEQIKKIEELHFAAEREKIDLQYELQKSRLDLQQLMSAEPPNQTAIFTQLEKISATELKMKKNRVGLMLKIRSLVSKEQWSKLETLRSEKFPKHKKMRKGHQGRPDLLGEPPSPEMPPEP